MQDKKNIIIREICKKDISSIKKIVSDIDLFSKEDKRISLELAKESLNPENKEGYITKCAESNSTLIGFICYGAASLCEGTYDLYYIAVDPACRRNGAGKALVMNAEEDLIKKKARMLLIETTSDPKYSGTLRFYEKLGYIEAERLEDYYKDGEDRIIFQKRFYAKKYSDKN